MRIEERWARSDYQALRGLAAELIAEGVVAIAATGDVASAKAAQQAGKVPVVFTIGSDPVRFGLVASLNRPGGHVTGVSLLTSMLGAKRIELLRQVAPKVSRVALVMNPSNPTATAEQADAEDGVPRLGSLLHMHVQIRDRDRRTFLRFDWGPIPKQRYNANAMMPISRQIAAILVTGSFIQAPAVDKRRQRACPRGALQIARCSAATLKTIWIFL